MGTTGSTFELSGGLWRNLQADYDPPQYTEATGLVCLSGSFCMLELSLAGVTKFNGHGWGPLALTATNQVSNQADAISCASTTFCLAVPWQGRDVWRWDGTSWFSAGTVGTTGELVSVSCPTTTFCKIGESGDNTLTYNGTALSAQQPGPSGGVNSITCTSATFCAAITTASFSQGVSTFDGTAWSATTTLVPPDSDALLDALTCADASHCHAIDFYGNDHSYDGHTWAAPRSFDPSSDSLITGLSCPTSTFCVLAQQGGAVSMMHGTTWTGPTQLHGYVLALSCVSSTFCVAVSTTGFYRWNGSSWHLEDVPGLADAGTVSISCPSSTFCLSVGNHTERFDGATWTEGTIPVAGVAVSCTSATFCAALAGTYRNPDPDRAHAKAHTTAFVSEQATTYNGASWSAPVTLKNFTWAQSISCGAPSYCVATGLAYGTGNMVSTTYSLGTWEPFVPIGPADGSVDFDESYVSCHGAGFCLASYLRVGILADAHAFNGARWGEGTPVAPQGLTLSCPSSTFCIGVGGTGRAYTWS